MHIALQVDFDELYFQVFEGEERLVCVSFSNVTLQRDVPIFFTVQLISNSLTGKMADL